MFEKLTPRMDRVIRTSQRIAREYGQDYVGTEHLLLGIIEEGTGTAAEILVGFGVDLAKTKAIVDKLIRNRLEDTWVMGRLPGTPHFRNVMATAIEEARQLESKVVCTEHLLVALAREEGSVAQAALQQLNVSPAAIRSEIIRRAESGIEGSGVL